MNIIIIGAHGKVGQLILQHMQDTPYQAIGMIRDKRQAQKLSDYDAKLVIADLEQDFEHTYRNIDVVIFTAGSGSKTGPDKTISVDQEGAIKSIDLAKKHGIKQYIMVSAQGARDPEAPSPIQHYFKAKSIADEYLIQSSLNYTLFRPGRLTDGDGTGMVKVSTRFADKGETNRENLAKSIITSIENPNCFNKIIEIFDGDEMISIAFSRGIY